jgi:hypothetical protein
MQIIDIPTEQTTAFTDLFLTLVSAAGVIWIIRKGLRTDRTKTKIWASAFSFLSTAALLGAIAHGIKMSSEINEIIWHPLNLLLGLSVALFVIGVIYDFQGFKIQKLILLLIFLSGLLFFSVTLIFPKLFAVFVLYEALAMIFALITYAYLNFKRKFPGGIQMTTGIFISIIAAIIQSIPSLNLNFIWEFDHNGLFHIIQTIGLLFLFSGLLKEFDSRVS